MKLFTNMLLDAASKYIQAQFKRLSVPKRHFDTPTAMINLAMAISTGNAAQVEDECMVVEACLTLINRNNSLNTTPLGAHTLTMFPPAATMACTVSSARYAHNEIISRYHDGDLWRFIPTLKGCKSETTHLRIDNISTKIIKVRDLHPLSDAAYTGLDGVLRRPPVPGPVVESAADDISFKLPPSGEPHVPKDGEVILPTGSNLDALNSQAVTGMNNLYATHLTKEQMGLKEPESRQLDSSLVLPASVREVNLDLDGRPVTEAPARTPYGVVYEIKEDAPEPPSSRYSNHG